MRAPQRRWAFRAVVLSLGAAGLALIVWSALAIDDHVALVAFLIAGALSSLLPAQARPGFSLSLVNVVAFAAVVLGGPPLAVLATVAAVVVEARTYRTPRWVRVVFNVGQFALAATLAALAYEALAPDIAHRLLEAGSVEGLTSVRGVVALGVAGLTFTAVNFGLVATAVALNSGERITSALRSTLPAIALQPLYLGLAVLAVVLAVDVHPLAVVLLVVPAIVARTGLVAIQREAEAYDELVLALVKLIEVKDGYTRGHGERVAALTVELANELNYGFERTRTARYAALLHDVGKISVPTRILRKPGSLDQAEYLRVKTHPEAGVELLADIDFLADARPAILAHHERIDGRGYPEGLSGQAIPELARVIAIVDAFDAMTSTRAYRRALDVPTAVARIRAAAGTQFDAELVAVFERVLARMDWIPTDEPELRFDVEIAAVPSW